MGKASTKAMYFGTLKWAMRSAQKLRTFFGQRRPLPKLDPHSHLLPKLGVGHAKDLRLLDSRMGVEKLLHFLGINVLTAANDHVLQAADDLHVAFLIHDREIAAVEPPRLIDGFPGAFIIAPVTRMTE